MKLFVGLPSPLSALNAAVQRSSNSLVDRPASLHTISGNGNSLSSTPIRPKPPSQPTSTSSATLTPISEAKLLSLPPGKYSKQ